MVPFIIVGEAKRKLKEVFVLAVAILVASVVWMALSGHNIWSIAIALFLFFVGFNILERVCLPWSPSFHTPEPKGPRRESIRLLNSSGPFVAGSSEVCSICQVSATTVTSSGRLPLFT